MSTSVSSLGLDPDRHEVDPDKAHTDTFDESWPGFLDELRTNPRTAFERFYRFTQELLRVHPPALARLVAAADREDILHDVVFHCCKDDFRVLRRYRNRGTPFSHWLRRVANRKIVDQIRRQRRERTGQAAGDLDQQRDERMAPADDRIDMQRALAITSKCLERLDEDCRILLVASAEGKTPREMTTLLGLPQDQNARVSDRCRYCRTKLKRMLKEEGIDIASILRRGSR